MNKLIFPFIALCFDTFNAAAKKDNVNVIFILADDMGYGELGCYGQKIIQTPNIDHLASNGILFTQYYAGSPVSAPSRSTLQTGLHSGHTPIRGNNELPQRGDIWNPDSVFVNPKLEGQCPMPSSTYTLGHLFKQKGYTTGMIGKWGLGNTQSDSNPEKMGYSYFYGYNCQRAAHSYFPLYLNENNERVILNDNRPTLYPKQKFDKNDDIYDEKNYDKYSRKVYSCDLMFDHIKEFITENKDNNFFLMWTTPLPHVPLYAPKELVEYYHNIIGDEEPYLGNQGYLPCRYPKATYAAMITYLDNQVGELVDFLKKENLYENTMIVFASDNGATYNGGTNSEFFNSNGLFNSQFGCGKGFLREGGIRVPLIISWPKKIKSGEKTDMICWSCDFMPTFAELLNVSIDQTDGISLLNLIKGKKKQKQHEYLYWEFPENGGHKAVRIGKWKGLIENVKKGNNKMLLYNLDVDPREQYDVADFYPTIVQQMKVIIDKSHEKSEIKEFNF